MSIVYIGIGSNLGDRRANIERSLEKLKARKDIEFKSVSSVIETEAVGGPGQPMYLNACCCIGTTLYPDEVLAALKTIEREMGRFKDSAPKKLSAQEQLKALDEGRMPSCYRDPDSDSAAANRWAPRVIDLDILLYDDIIMKGNNLIIPHSRMHERYFVLKPLSEIAPDVIHPVLKKSIKDLLSDVDRQCLPAQEG
ncbi:MAG: 2-amino-4-hydroxy-6-hydroxymethyldihydropteridine diphosphokinase [Candidatus Omnitrophica bacterium]|nr:2-amino-4-hydroxy-6-hydroxymethyldihydropteridine diphosphokinase [Candidatus Omnitrophota bacterium]